MNKFINVLEPSLNDSAARETSAMLPTDKRLGKPHSPSEEEFAQAMVDSMNRMAVDEDYRLQIARQLS